MYWNRDLVSAANFTAPPTSWDQMYDYVKAITKKSPNNLDVTRATVALGQYDNVDHATDLLSTLFIQAGAKISYIYQDNKFKTDLSTSASRDNVVAALRYYTEFSNPTSAAYTWNAALPSSRDAFLGNTLALYFGPASEYRFIREANPNLNFDVAQVPQPQGVVRPLTYGHMIGLAISRMSANKRGALNVAIGLSGPQLNGIFADALGLVPVRRDLLSSTQSDPWKAVAYRAGLNAKAWYQPSAEHVATVFQTMIESVIGGKLDVSRAVNNASNDLGEYLSEDN
jgi:ABC-type glycerol-3-phosphate transport system substrate-binding protein